MPTGPTIHRMVVKQRRAAVDGLGDRDVVLHGEVGERVVGERIVDAAAGDDQRLLGFAQKLRRLADRVGVGPRAGNAVDRLLEERDGIVVGLGLGVLGEADEGRAAVAGSSIMAIAWGSDDRICSGRRMRSQ